MKYEYKEDLREHLKQAIDDAGAEALEIYPMPKEPAPGSKEGTKPKRRPEDQRRYLSLRKRLRFAVLCEAVSEIFGTRGFIRKAWYSCKGEFGVITKKMEYEVGVFREVGDYDVKAHDPDGIKAILEAVGLPEKPKEKKGGESK